jgi:hypothetical protein
VRVSGVTNLRKEARGRGCQVRLPGICNHNSETVVLAHVRLIGISGFGTKSPDILGTWACSACHAYADSHHDDETNAAFANGVYRTIAQLVRESVIKW